MLTPLEHRRYRRHLLLPSVGPAGQERLKEASVLCVGAGGLGCPALLYLAAAGVGRIGIVDPDTVALSNLQRQVLYRTADLGHPKPLAAARALTSLNPHLRIDAFCTALTAENAFRIFGGFDVVLDATDDFPTRYLIDDACSLLGIPVVYGAVARFEGQLAVFAPDGPSYRDLYPAPPAPEEAPSCADAGVLGVLPGLIGTLQALEALKLLLDLGASTGKLLVVDALGSSFYALELPTRPHRRPVHDLQPMCANRVIPLSAAQLSRRLQDGWSPRVFDLRPPEEAARFPFPAPHRVVAPNALPEAVRDLPRDRAILLLCHAGIRSASAANALAEAGFTAVHELRGGMLAWAALDAHDPRE